MSEQTEPVMDWQRTDGAIPTYELITDPLYFVEKWGMGSWAAYRGEERIGEPGTYGTRAEAQVAAEAAHKTEHTGGQS